VLDMLTRTVPDGAWLTQLRVEGSKVVLNGNADDAAALVQKLTGQPGVSNARMTQPATRAAGAAKETFVIEVNLDARRYGPAHAGSGNGNGNGNGNDSSNGTASVGHSAARASAAANAASASASAASAAASAAAPSASAASAASAASPAASAASASHHKQGAAP